MFEILPERAGDGPAIDRLLDLAFGPGRQAKTVYRLRHRQPPLAELSFVGQREGRLVGSIRFWPVEICDRAQVRALLLGPVAVEPALQGRGIGQALVRHGLDAARRLGHGAVVLVGDAPYYGRFGFERRLAEALTLPGPVDLDRFLALELVPGALAGVGGAVVRPRGQLRPVDGAGGGLRRFSGPRAARPASGRQAPTPAPGSPAKAAPARRR
jgi:predicted N-acetyltransferase YhbS